MQIQVIPSIFTSALVETIRKRASLLLLICYILLRDHLHWKHPQGFIIYQKSPQPYFVNGAEYPSWVKEDMMLILEETGGCDSPYIFRTKSDPKIVLSCFQDEVGAPITMEEYHVTGNTSRQRFTLQNPPS